MNQEQIIQKYLKNHTKEDLAKKMQGINSCSNCHKSPLVYIDCYFEGEKFVIYGLCQECFLHFHDDNKGFRKKIEQKMRQDNRYDTSPYN